MIEPSYTYKNQVTASISGRKFHPLFLIVIITIIHSCVLNDDFVLSFSFISIDNNRRCYHQQTCHHNLQDMINFHRYRGKYYPTFVTNIILQQQSALLLSWIDSNDDDNSGGTNLTMISEFNNEKLNRPLDDMLSQEMAQEKYKNIRNSSNVSGLQCVHVPIHLPLVGCITILEATAESQEILVDLALEDTNEYNEHTLYDNNAISSNQQQQQQSNINQQRQQQIDSSTNDGSSISLSKGDPYGAVLWPASSAIAAYLLSKKIKCDTYDSLNDNDNEDNVFFLNNKIIIEIGAGTGLISIAAASKCSLQLNSKFISAKAVIATDYEYIPLKLLHFAAKNLNPQCNYQMIHTTYFDICNFNMTLSSLLLKVKSPEYDSDNNSNHTIDQHTMDDNKNIISNNCMDRINPNDVVIVASDIMYEPKTGIAMAKRVIEALDCGYHVIIGDSPGRAGRPAFLNELERHFSSIILSSSSKTSPIIPHFMNVAGNKVKGDRHELICSKESITHSKVVNNTMFESIDIAIMDLDPFIYRIR